MLHTPRLAAAILVGATAFALSACKNPITGEEITAADIQASVALATTENPDATAFEIMNLVRIDNGFPARPEPTVDTNGDGVPDGWGKWTDANGDGLPDGWFEGTDADGDGFPDTWTHQDGDNDGWHDEDADGTPDGWALWRDLDSDGTPDVPAWTDVDGDGKPDHPNHDDDAAPITLTDADGDGQPDGWLKKWHGNNRPPILGSDPATSPSPGVSPSVDVSPSTGAVEPDPSPTRDGKGWKDGHAPSEDRHNGGMMGRDKDSNTGNRHGHHGGNGYKNHR